MTFPIVQLAEVCTKIGSGSTPRGGSASYLDHGIPLVRSTNVRMFSIDETDLAFISDEQAHALDNVTVKPGDVLLNITGIGTLGRVCVTPESLAGARVNQHVCIVRPSASLDPKYLMYFLGSPDQQAIMNGGASGMTRQALTKAKIEGFCLPLPPLDEQRRIVARIEEMMERSRRAWAALEVIPQEGQSLITNVLFRAVSGALTADWRIQYPGECVLPDRHSCANDAAHSDSFKPAWKLPSSWAFVSVGQAGDVQLGRQRAPKYHAGENMRPYLRTANVFEGRIDTSDVLSMEFGEKDFETYRLRYGDILLNEGQSRELVGRPAMFRDELPIACFQNTLVRFRSADDVVPEYALIVFRYYLRSGRFQQIAQWSTNIAHLGASRFAQIEFPLPPLSEQEEIVRRTQAEMERIHMMMQLASQTERELATLERSILQAAFQGDL